MRKTLHGIPPYGAAINEPEANRSDDALPTRIVRANWQADWKWPVPQGYEPVGRLVNGAGETGGMMIYGAVVFRKQYSKKYFLGMAGKLSPLNDLPPIVNHEDDDPDKR